MNYIFDLHILFIIIILLIIITYLKKNIMIEKYQNEIIKTGSFQFDTRLLTGYELVKEIFNDIFVYRNNTITINKDTTAPKIISNNLNIKTSMKTKDIKPTKDTNVKTKNLNVSNISVSELEVKEIKKKVIRQTNNEHVQLSYGTNDYKKLLSLSVIGGLISDARTTVPLILGTHQITDPVVSNRPHYKTDNYFANTNYPSYIILYPGYKIKLLQTGTPKIEHVIENNTDDIQVHDNLLNILITNSYELSLI